MAKIEELYDFIEKKWFVTDLKENRLGHIKLAFVREIINPLIIRSTDAEATITLAIIDNREIVEIPPRKLKSREKLLGLLLCREFNVIDNNVHYNSILDSNHLNNPNSILFGDSVTQSQDAAALPSRAIYDWAYSLRDVKDVTDKLQHNSMSEDGTILKDKDFNPKQDDGTKVASQALYQTEYVLPNTFFPHFITVDNISTELFVHLLLCVLNQYRYGAQTTTNANNMINHLVGIGFADFEKPINSYTISKNWNEGKKGEVPTLSSVKAFVREQITAHYSAGGLVNDVDTLVTWLNGLWTEKDKTSLKEIYSSAKTSVDSYLKNIKMIKSSDGGTRRSTKKTAQ